MAQVQSRNRATSDPEARKSVLEADQGRRHRRRAALVHGPRGSSEELRDHASEVEGALDDGMGFDGSSITGFNAIEESDMVAIPDPEHLPRAVAPGGKVGRMICDVVTPDGNPYDGDPRHVLRLALERMKAMGFDTFNVGPEAEYFLFKDEHGTETLDEGGYFAQTTMDAATTSAATRSARSSRWASRSSTTTTRSGPRSTRSTCATRTRSTWPTTCSRTASSSRRSPSSTATTRPSCRSRSSARTAPGCTRTSRSSARGATASSTGTTSGTCPRRARRSSPASCVTRARSPPCSRSG